MFLVWGSMLFRAYMFLVIWFYGVSVFHCIWAILQFYISKLTGGKLMVMLVFTHANTFCLVGGSIDFALLEPVSSVTQSCLTLCNPMDCSMPGFPVLTTIPVACSNWCPSSQWCHPTISFSVIPFSSRLPSFPVSGYFQMSRFFTSGGQSIGVSASASVLSMDIQDWFPLGWTGWISLLSKGLSRVFSNTTVQKHQFFGSQPS